MTVREDSIIHRLRQMGVVEKSKAVVEAFDDVMLPLPTKRRYGHEYRRRPDRGKKVVAK